MLTHKVTTRWSPDADRPGGMDSDGWVKLRHDARPLPAQDPEKHGLELSDDFTGKQLGLQWTFWKEYAPESSHSARTA